MGELIACVTSRTSTMRKVIRIAQRKIECGRVMVAPSAVDGHAPENAPTCCGPICPLGPDEAGCSLMEPKAYDSFLAASTTAGIRALGRGGRIRSDGAPIRMA